MRLTAFTTLTFFLALNLSLYVMNYVQVLPSYTQSPYSDPDAIKENFLSVNLSGTSLLIGISTLAIGGLLSYIFKQFVYGGTVTIVLFALEMLFPAIRWILFGFPEFLGIIITLEPAKTMIVTFTSTVLAFVWFWFIIGLLAQRAGWET